MTAKLSTDKLLTALDELDVREGDVVAALLARAAELRRRRSLSAEDLAALGQSLTGLVTVIGGVQQAIARTGSAAPPALDALQAQLAANAAEFDRLRAELRAGIVALEAEAGASHEPPDQHGRTLRLVKDRMKGTDVANLQRELNLRLERWGVHKRIAESGTYDAQTRLAAHQVAYGLGIETAAFKHGITPAVRELIHAPSRRTPDQITPRPHAPRVAARAAQALRPRHAEGPGGVVAARCVVAPHAVAQRPRPTRPRRTRPRCTPTPAWPPPSVRPAATTRTSSSPRRGAPRCRVSLVCAVMEAESSFTNVFGHDGVDNPIKSVHGRPNLVVTEALYKTYVQHRRPGRGVPGRGAHAAHGEVPAGSRRPPRRLLQAGAEHPDRRRAPGSAHQGARQHARRPSWAYNGTTAYADAVIKLQKVWHTRLEAHASGSSSNGHGSKAGHATPARAPGKPRTLRMTEPKLMSGSDVRAFQHLVNHRLAAWGVREHVAENGVYGIDTRHAAHQGRPRPGPRARRIRARHDAGRARADAHAEPADARAAPARRVAPRLGGEAAQGL